jgi:hypothetical protein
VTPPTDIIFNPEYPYNGTINERIELTKKLNERLRYYCNAFGMEFLDVYDSYSNKEGSLKKEMGDGNVHVHPLCFHAIEEKLQKILIINGFLNDFFPSSI